MRYPRIDAGRISLLIASLNLSVPPSAQFIGGLAAELASNSEGAVWSWVLCIILGALISLGLVVAWLRAIIVAGTTCRIYAGLFGLGILLNGVAISWTFLALHPER